MNIPFPVPVEQDTSLELLLTSALGLKKKKNNYSKSIVNIYVSYNFTSKYSKNSYKIGTKNYIKTELQQQK